MIRFHWRTYQVLLRTLFIEVRWVPVKGRANSKYSYEIDLKISKNLLQVLIFFYNFNMKFTSGEESFIHGENFNLSQLEYAL